jgi:hypothetical protein
VSHPAGRHDVTAVFRVMMGAAIALTIGAACSSPPRTAGMKPEGGAQSHLIHSDTTCRRLVMRAKTTQSADTIRMARSCAWVQDSIRKHHMADIASAELLRQGRVVMDIPEYHDEQRLPADTRPFLGPLVGIFTSPFLGSFRRDWQLLEHPNGAVLAAYLVVYLERVGRVQVDGRGTAWLVRCRLGHPGPIPTAGPPQK